VVCRLSLLMNLQHMTASRNDLPVGVHLQSRPSCETTLHTSLTHHWNNSQPRILLAAWKRESDVPCALSSVYGECSITLDSSSPGFFVCNESTDVVHIKSTPKSAVNTCPTTYSGDAAARHRHIFGSISICNQPLPGNA
jgi:hypothetical protein